MATTEAALRERILRPDGSEMSKATAKAILELTLPEDDQERMHDLIKKAKGGRIDANEAMQLDEFERCGNLLSILKAKARRIVKPRR